MQLHYDGARVNPSATATAQARAPIAQLKLCSSGSDGCPTCDHFFPRWVPALPYVSASLSHRPGQGCFCFCSCSGPLLLESAVCSDRPQFGIHLFCFLFLCPAAQVVLARPNFPPSIRQSYLQALGPQQLAWPNCLIAIPGGSYLEQSTHDFSCGPTNRKLLDFPPSVSGQGAVTH